MHEGVYQAPTDPQQVLMNYQLELSQLAQSQMEQVANHLTGVMESYISAKIDTVGRQVSDANLEQSSKLDKVLVLTYVLIVLVILSTVIVVLSVWYSQARSTSKMLEEFRAVCRNVIRSANVQSL
jgi:hypothetical protein